MFRLPVDFYPVPVASVRFHTIYRFYSVETRWEARESAKSLAAANAHTCPLPLSRLLHDIPNDDSFRHHVRHLGINANMSFRSMLSYLLSLSTFRVTDLKPFTVRWYMECVVLSVCHSICGSSLSPDRRSRLRGGILCPEIYGLHLHGWGSFRDGTSPLCRQGIRCCSASSEGLGTAIIIFLSGSREPARISITLPLISRIHPFLPMGHPSSSGNHSCMKEDTVTAIVDRCCRIQGQDCNRQVL
jgi:hypothetical protein